MTTYGHIYPGRSAAKAGLGWASKSLWAGGEGVQEKDWGFIICELVYLWNFFKFKNSAKWMSTFGKMVFFPKDQCSLARTNTNSLHKNCPSFISQLKLPDSFSSAASFEVSNLLHPPPLPLSLLLLNPFWGGENAAICSRILTKVDLARLLFHDFITIKWTSSKMAVTKECPNHNHWENLWPAQ